MRQINFGLIFGFGLITVFFTLENTAPTTVQLLPGMDYTPSRWIAPAGGRSWCRCRLVLRCLDRNAQQRESTEPGH